MTEAEEKIPIRRRSKPNLGGRPRIEDIIDLTPEMMEVARQIQMGYTAEEIAPKLSCTVEKIKRYLENPTLLAYTKRLLGGDRVMEADGMRWSVFSSLMNYLTKVFTGKEKEVSPSVLQAALQLHARLDPFELLKSMENPQVEELKKRLINPGGKQPLQLKEQGPKEDSIFEPMDMEREPGEEEEEGKEKGDEDP